jgi:WD40 repeat protein
LPPPREPREPGGSVSGEVRTSGPSEVYDAVDFGPEGREMVVSSLTTRVRIERLADRSIAGTLIHPARVFWVAYSPDKRWIVTQAHD